MDFLEENNVKYQDRIEILLFSLSRLSRVCRFLFILWILKIHLKIYQSEYQDTTKHPFVLILLSALSLL